MAAGLAADIARVFVILAAVDGQVCCAHPDEESHEKLHHSPHAEDAASQSCVDDQGGGVAESGAVCGLRKAASLCCRYAESLVNVPRGVKWIQSRKEETRLFLSNSTVTKSFPGSFPTLHRGKTDLGEGFRRTAVSRRDNPNSIHP